MPVIDYNSSLGVFSAAEALTDRCLNHYREHGWILLKGFYGINDEIRPIHEDINRLIALKRDQLGISPRTNSGWTVSSNDFIELCTRDRAKGGEIYRACRHLRPLQVLLTKQQTLALMERLMATDFVYVHSFTAVRIDIRGEEKYLFDWHQDYPYTQGSVDGVVLWAPLEDVQKGSGGIKLIPGSHVHGILPVRLLDPQNQQGNGAHSIKIVDSASLDDEVSYRMDVEMGDVLVFSTLLVHKSLPMEKGGVRWSMQLRYSNFRHPAAIARGWPGGLLEGSWFEDIHPESIKS